MPGLYFIHDKPIENNLEVTINVMYIILDWVILTPSLIAMILFFRGVVNFLWISIMIGLICEVIGDTIFLIEKYNKTFIPGSVVEIFFLWTYIFFIYGVYDQIKLFKITKKQ